MKLHQLVATTSLLLAIAAVASIAQLERGPHDAMAGPALTATPCPTAKVPDTFGGSGCGTPTPTPTSIRVPPMIAIDFTVNSVYEVSAALGQPLTFRQTYYNTDHRAVNVEATVELDGVSQGNTLCHTTPGGSCAISTTGVADRLGTLKAVAYITAAVDSCGLCPTLSEERSILVHVAGQPGDFNCDGVANAIDAALILQVGAGLAPPLACTGDGDVNRDGELNAVDAALVLQYVAGLIESLS